MLRSTGVIVTAACSGMRDNVTATPEYYAECAPECLRSKCCIYKWYGKVLVTGTHLTYGDSFLYSGLSRRQREGVLANGIRGLKHSSTSGCLWQTEWR